MALRSRTPRGTADPGPGYNPRHVSDTEPVPTALPHRTAKAPEHVTLAGRPRFALLSVVHLRRNWTLKRIINVEDAETHSDENGAPVAAVLKRGEC